MKFSHLHVHTQFSLLDGAASIPALYKKAAADGQPALAITDHGNMFGVFKFVAEAGKHKNEDGTPKVKPIVGCEFYVVSDRHKKSFTREDKDKRFHQLMLAKNATGYKNLSKLCSLGLHGGLLQQVPAHRQGADREVPRRTDRHHVLLGCECAAGHPARWHRRPAEGRGGVQVVAGPLRRGLLRGDPTPRHPGAGPGERRAAAVGDEVQRADHRQQRQPLCGPGGQQRARHPAVHQHRREAEHAEGR